MGSRKLRLSYCLDCSADVRITKERTGRLSRPDRCPVCGSSEILSALLEPTRGRTPVGYA